MASLELCSDRPVLSVVHNRICHYEAMRSRVSRPIVDALMEELGELRSKLISALAEELNHTMATSVLRTLVRRIKKYQRKRDNIVRVEESRASGETLKAEQEEVLRSKPIVSALLEELSELAWQLISALVEELRDVCDKTNQFDACRNTYNPIEQLLRLVNLPSLLDVSSQSGFPSVMLMRRYEKGCLMYDYMTRKDVQLLSENDQKFISLLGSLVTSPPVNQIGSHKSSLVATASRSCLISESTSKQEDGGSKRKGKMKVHAKNLSPKMKSPFGPSCGAMSSCSSGTSEWMMDFAPSHWDALDQTSMDIVFISL